MRKFVANLARVAKACIAPFMKHKIKDSIEWSKGFIEHLRTIHFILILVSATCILVALSPDIIELQRAQHQLKQLTTVFNDITQRGRLYHDAAKTEKRKWLVFKVKNKSYAVSYPRKYSTLEWTQKCSDQISFHEHTNVKELYGFVTHATSLDDYKSIVNLVNCTEVIDHDVIGVGNALLGDKGQSVQFHVVISSPDKLQQSSIIESVFSFEETKRDDLATERFSHPFRFDEQTDENDNTIGNPAMYGLLTSSDKTQVPSKPERTIEYRGAIGYQDLSLPVRVKDEDHDGVTKVNVSTFRDKFCWGYFDDCFDSLTRVTMGKSKDSTKDISEWLDSEIAQAKNKQWEFLGLKPPAANDSYWAIIIIIGVMWYLWLHLRQLSTAVKNDGRDSLHVAWVGLYHSWSAQPTVWSTVLILPIIAIILLVFRSLHYEFSSFTDIYHYDFSSFTDIHHWRTLSPLYGAVLFSVILSIYCCLLIRRISRLASMARKQGHLQPDQEANAVVAGITMATEAPVGREK